MVKGIVVAALSLLVAALPQAGVPARSDAPDPTPPAGRPSPPGEAGPPSTLTGDLRTHDPALVRETARGGDWYVFSTGDPAVGGGNVQIRRSEDSRHWTYVGTVFEEIPAWVRAEVPGVTNIWAPEVVEHDGLYYLYYAASTFGSNRSVIGLATNTTLDSDDPAYQWADRGLVTRSVPENDYNAIDAGVGRGPGRYALDGVRVLLERHPDAPAAMAGREARPRTG